MPATTLAGRATRWYEQHARDLPWRRPGTSAWGVLVSEVMLQQTPVARVAPAWPVWLQRWPAPDALASSSPGEAIHAWGRLGYPRRALRLHRAASAIVDRHGGTVPAELDLLLALPGIGAYTARAVATFAFGHRHAVVDTNVRRLMARVVAGRPDSGTATTAADLATVERQLPADPAAAARASAAFMELGALVCTARRASCDTCPLRSSCLWQQRGQPAAEHGRPRRSPGYVGTDRQVRGLLLALARESRSPVARAALDTVWPDRVQRVRALGGLLADGLLVETGPDHFGLPGTT